MDDVQNFVEIGSTKDAKSIQVNTKALVDRFFDFDADRIKATLKEFNLPSSGIKQDMRFIVEKALIHRNLTEEDLFERILEWEPWSHRHVYFIKLAKADRDKISQPTYIQEQLLLKKITEYVGREQAFFLPLQLKLDHIKIESNTISITILAPHYTYERAPAEDQFDENSDRVARISYRKRSRKAFHFELNLKTGRGYISIPAVQKGGRYNKERDSIEKMVRGFLGLSEFEISKIRPALEKLVKSDDVVSNSLAVSFAGDLQMSLKSTKKKKALFADKSTKALEKFSQTGFYSEGAFYYPLEGKKSEFRFKLYDDERLGIFSDLDEKEFRDVIRLVLSNA
ncbi:hypothetical protein [Bdellovibrio bacteriovorus]|uniref:hypothetical protein n=1 Tax=Bdellovibrio bacteriovorus TaxID=959 RepID=UPI0035A709BD